MKLGGFVDVAKSFSFWGLSSMLKFYSPLRADQGSVVVSFPQQFFAHSIMDAFVSS